MILLCVRRGMGASYVRIKQRCELSGYELTRVDYCRFWKTKTSEADKDA